MTPWHNRAMTKTATARKATWEMNSVELAKVFADHFGYSHRGNWITRPDGLGVACGWEHFAKRIAAQGWIKVGSGINWRRAGEQPAIGKATRSAKGYWL